MADSNYEQIIVSEYKFTERCKNGRVNNLIQLFINKVISDSFLYSIFTILK